MAAAAVLGASALSAGPVPGSIVGGGRVGNMLFQAAGGVDELVRRGEPVTSASGPIYVCTRNDDLDAVVEATPEARRCDLVFLQNGMLKPFLQRRGLYGTATEALAYFAVAKKGEAPTDGKTELDPDGLTAAHGPWAEDLRTRLQAAGLSCRVVDRFEFDQEMYGKLIWISAVMLLGAKHSLNVGEVDSQQRPAFEALVSELAAAANVAYLEERGRELGLGADLPQRLSAYSRSVAHFPCAVKEMEYRNGFFYGVSQRCLSAGQPDPCPTHTALLREIGAVPAEL